MFYQVNFDFFSKLILLFTLKVFVPQTDVLSGKSRDFRAFQSSLGLAKVLHFLPSCFLYFFVSMKFQFLKFFK